MSATLLGTAVSLYTDELFPSIALLPPTASYSPQVASIPLQTLQELHILVFIIIIIEKGPQIKNIQQIWVSACVSGHC